MNPVPPADINRQTWSLPAPLAAEVLRRAREWDAQDGTRRLWAGDASLWTGQDEGRWIGWIGAVERQREELTRLARLSEEVAREGFAHALVLGMGGSSLCPEVLAETFGRQPGRPDLHVLDSTDPARVASFEDRLDLARTLFIVSSKSGTTLEPNIFMAYFLERTKERVGAAEAGRRFLAVTDPGSALEKAARAEGFREVFAGIPEVGGRYSALSSFGMVPAAVMGLDVPRLVDHATRMVEACSPGVPAEENPGVALGTLLGVLGERGIDKVTFIAAPGLRDIGAWLEQLLAESTGKQGKGLIPVDRERAGPPEIYDGDRLFVYLRLASDPDRGQDAAVDALERAGLPLVRIDVDTPYGVAEEFFRWEVATAVAGSLLHINPFDQPDVEASKVATRALTAEYEKTGQLPAERPLVEADGLRLFADPANAEALKGTERSLDGLLRAHLARLHTGDYFALLAYLEMSPRHEQDLQSLRHRVRDTRRVATCLGFGPRFLHSTGQAYKGGPNHGVFVQVTCDDARDLPVPGQRYTFGVVKAAQARGDFQVLAERGRRLLRVHLGPDVEGGLRVLDAAVERALA